MSSKPTSGIAVDGATEGNPGFAAYRGVDIATGKELFKVKIGYSTNNIAEFLGIVHAIAYCNKEGIDSNIYTDSQTALAWVKKQYCGSSVDPDKGSYSISLVKRALGYLFANKFNYDRVLKWETKRWGEIPADWGRK